MRLRYRSDAQPFRFSGADVLFYIAVGVDYNRFSGSAATGYITCLRKPVFVEPFQDHLTMALSEASLALMLVKTYKTCIAAPQSVFRSSIRDISWSLGREPLHRGAAVP